VPSGLVGVVHDHEPLGPSNGHDPFRAQAEGLDVVDAGRQRREQTFPFADGQRLLTRARRHDAQPRRRGDLSTAREHPELRRHRRRKVLREHQREREQGPHDREL
jgi:hypothetical protein